ncbi:metal-dependent hydrolase [Halobellus ruber]|uniref:Metal-dependent hydrolase n=1 Tax=Halobellus ruber TaxID=2761102 RepID=A0A7J9SGJ1_9EURY|nr:metal-dependent hydrolase [Halobellus ruber]MBB6645513.1 metal-dependent hydrolase [Halobellus ruber]
MPDLLTHVLVAYAVGGVAVRWTDAPDRNLPLLLVGAAAPDAMKASVLLDVPVGTAFGIPYSMWGLHTLGGVVVLSGAGALTLSAGERRSGFGVLVCGGLSHLVLDLFVVRVDGVAPPYLFPVSGWLPPAANLYASTDLWTIPVAVALALPVWVVRRRSRSASASDQTA